MPSLRKATSEDIPLLADMLGRAFMDDPVSNYVFPDVRGRQGALSRFFGIQLRHDFVADGEVYMTDDLTGAALWSPPGKLRPGLAALAALTPMIPLIWRRLPLTLRMLQMVESRHPKEPHFYLGVLGTEPAMQGQGIGSSVLAPVLEKCDQGGIPAYLESSKDRNVPFYARHGFQVTGTLDLPKNGPRMWTMWRTPRPG